MSLNATTPTYNRLLAAANATGKVRVIIGLNVAAKPEGLLTAAQITNQRTAIQSAKTTLLNLLAPFRIRTIATQWNIPFIAAEISPTTLQYLKGLPQVTTIEEDKILRLVDTETNNVIDVPEAWALGYDGTGQTIAILDTGIQRNHPFLASKVVEEACFTDNNCPNAQSSQIGTGSGMPCTITGCDHGTHVAGIAAGTGGGGTGALYSGVAQNASLMSIRIFTARTSNHPDCAPDPSCVIAYSADVISGLYHVFSLSTKYNIAAVNLSLAGQPYTDENQCHAENSALKLMIDQLSSAQIAPVIAAGNDGLAAIDYPACVSSAISVSATDDFDQVPPFANSHPMLELFAPGVAVQSSVSPSGYASYDGTSMAAPHVAGAWAVLKQKSPASSVTDILTVLQNTGVMVQDALNPTVRKPRIDLDNALNALRPPPTRTLTPSPVAPRTFIVNVNDDEARGNCTLTCSLRDAVALATSGDMITFSITGRIQLYSTLVIDKSLTIDGRTSVTLFQDRAGLMISIVETAVTFNNLMIEFGCNCYWDSDRSSAIKLTGYSAALTTNGVQITGMDFHSYIGIEIDNIQHVVLNQSTIRGRQYLAIDSEYAYITITNSTFDSTGGLEIQGGTLTIADSTFKNNSGIDIIDETVTTIKRSTFSDICCRAIENQGFMTIEDSSFINNRGKDKGGAIYNGDTLTIKNSAFAGNQTIDRFNEHDGGGAIYSGYWSILLDISNSTFNGNSTAVIGTGTGGAIYTGAKTTRILNSTIAGNSAHYAGGIYLYYGSLTLLNTIIASNSGRVGTEHNCTYIPEAVRFGTNHGVGNIQFGDAGSCGTDIPIRDPKLGALQNNGGFTWTMALLSGSGAVDIGDPELCSEPPVRNLDQRGVSRLQGRQCDSGAFESSLTATSTPTRRPTNTVMPNHTSTPTMTFTPSRVPSRTSTGTSTHTLAPTITLTTSVTPTSPTLPLRLQYRTGDTITNDNQIKPHFRIINQSGAVIPLSELTIRYWFTRDTAQPMTFNCSFILAGCQTVTGTFFAINPIREGADYYLEIGFTPEAGNVGNSGTTLTTRFNKDDWSRFQETNDYSFDITKTDYTDWQRVTLYRNGRLLWGVEPQVGNTTSTALPTNTLTLIATPVVPTNTPVPNTATFTPTYTPTQPATTVPTATRTPTQPPTAPIRLQYRTGDTVPNDYQVKPNFRIINQSGTVVPLSELKIRYWFTRDTAQPMTFNCNYFLTGCNMLTSTFVAVQPARTGADYYLEIGFLPEAGNVSSTGTQVLTRFNKNDWSAFNENDDYSFDISKTVFVDWDRVTLYRNGVLIWGVEPPVSATSTLTATFTPLPATPTRTRTPRPTVTPPPTACPGGVCG